MDAILYGERSPNLLLCQSVFVATHKDEMLLWQNEPSNAIDGAGKACGWAVRRKMTKVYQLSGPCHEHNFIRGRDTGTWGNRFRTVDENFPRSRLTCVVS